MRTLRESPVGRGKSSHVGPEVGVCLSYKTRDVERPCMQNSESRLYIKYKE